MSPKQDRLARLLVLVPWVARHPEGVLVASLCQQLGVSRRQLEADVMLLCMVGQPPLTPDHLVEIAIEDDRVFVYLHQQLTTPLRLTREEARALLLGLQLLGDSVAAPKETLAPVIDKLLSLFGTTERAQLCAWLSQVATGHGTHATDAADAGLAPVLRHAMASGHEVLGSYYSLSSDRRKTYRLQPLALLNHTGVDYLLAWDTAAAVETENKAQKLFRLDRFAWIEATQTTFEPPNPAQLGLERYRGAFLGDAGSHLGRSQRRRKGVDEHSAAEPVLVRFAKHLGTALQERFGTEKLTQDPGDGTWLLSLEGGAAHPRWLARWLLPYGDDAELVAPATQRRMLHQLCADAAALYAD